MPKQDNSCLKKLGIGCGVGLLALGLFFFLLYKIAIAPLAEGRNSMSKEWAKIKADAQTLPNGGETYEYPSDPSRIDPFVLEKSLRAKVGENARLYSIEAKFVRSDGTMDLNADYTPEPTIEYRFYKEVRNDSVKLPPVGAGRSVGDVWLERTVVTCSKPGEQKHYVAVTGRHNTSVYYTTKGEEFERSSPYLSQLDDDLGDPKVTVESLWKVAIEKGAPKDAVATIVMNMNGYHFSINGSKPDLYFDFDGNLKH